jgi:RimJ/RimL family protein N-acetyltransferase
MSDIIFLEGKRVVLRPVQRADIPHFLKWVNDQEVTRYLRACMPVMEADEEGWFESLHKKKQTDIVLTLVVCGKPIGLMGIHQIDWIARTAFTGALIGEKNYWGKGYGSEAKMLLLDFAFNSLGLRKICSMVIAYNKRSYAYIIKCGYKEEGLRKKQIFKEGKYWDEILLAVFRKDWLPYWKKFQSEQIKIKT